MLDWLVIWGVANAALFVFRPILEDLAKDVVKDAAKSYVQKCFKSVFSVIYRDPLTKTTGRALNELLELIQNELLDCDLDREVLKDWIDDVRLFTRHEDVRTTIGSLFLEPGHKLDPAVFARAWQEVAAHTLPDDFSWSRIAKRFSRKLSSIRESSEELRDMFDRLANIQTSEDIRELRGLPPDFNLDTYQEALIERFGNLNFEILDTTGAYYSGVRLWSVFVPQSVRECHEYTPQLLEMPKEHIKRLIEKGELNADELAKAEQTQDVRRREYFRQPLRPVLEMVDDSAMKRAVILGDPGSGKSSLLRFLALRWARIEDANLRYTQPLPLLIELRDYNRWNCPSGKSFPRYLNDAQTWHRLNQQTLDHLLKQPDRVVLLLDGLDEVFDPAQRELVLNDIHRFSNEYPNTRVVVTSRVVGYQPQRLHNAEFRNFMLQDLNEQQIDNFLDKWHDVTFENKEEAQVKQQRLARAIRDSKPIAMLAGNPLLLTMMAILNRHQELPRDRADLYSQASRVLLQQWDTERALGEYPKLRGEVDLRAKTAILRRVAYTMQTGPHGLKGNIIDGQTLTGLIEDYLHDELHFDQPRAPAAAVVKQLRERNFILCFLGADSYAFVHRTFLEYFCAADFVHRFHVEKTLDIDGLIAVFDQHCRDDEWREVLRLICGQIDEQFVGQIVEHLAQRTDLENWDGEKPLPELVLAIGCLSEVRNPGRLHSSGRSLLDQIMRIISKAGDESYPIVIGQLLPVSIELGSRWPGRDSLTSETYSKVIPGSLGSYFWPKFVAHVFSDRNIIQRFLSTEQGLYGGLLRWGAIEALAENWPDETTRTLLEEHAVQDEYDSPRSAALRALAEKWPDENTRKLLEERAVKDKVGSPRSAALRALAENWPDENTRKLLEERAIQDRDGSPRSAALRLLAEKWPDEKTRKLLEERAVQDEDYEPRLTAFQALAENWPDEKTRKLLEERVVHDDEEDDRRAALETLVKKWQDENTRKLLEERAGVDGVAASVFGGRHSEFGRIVFREFIEDYGPYLDPDKPISRKRIKQAAKKANVPAEKIDETVQSLSQHMGWDITKGRSK